MLDSYPKMVAEADDPYLFLRNLYLQRLERDVDALRDAADGNEAETH